MLGSHDEQWHRYKTLKWAWSISVLGFLPVLAIAGMLARGIFQKQIQDTASAQGSYTQVVVIAFKSMRDKTFCRCSSKHAIRFSPIIKKPCAYLLTRITGP